MVMPALVGTVRCLASLVILRRTYLMAKNGFVYQVLFIAVLALFLVLGTVRDEFSRLLAIYLLMTSILEVIYP